MPTSTSRWLVGAILGEHRRINDAGIDRIDLDSERGEAGSGELRHAAFESRVSACETCRVRVRKWDLCESFLTF